MYVNCCRGGYPSPLTSGEVSKLEIWGVRATVSDTSAVSALTLIDAPGALQTGTNNDITLIDAKGLVNDTELEVMFPEPIKTRRGVAATTITNLVQGSILLYVR